MTIADIHAHIFPRRLAEKAAHSIGDFYDMKASYAASLDNLLVLEENAGIRYAAVSSSATSAGQVRSINDFISESANSHENLIALGTLFPTMENWEEELDRMEELGIQGVKIHSDFQSVPIDEPRAIPMYRAVARRGLPVLFHMGDNRYNYSAPERLTNLVRQVPDLIAIAAHFGGWRDWSRSFAHPQPENVFYDTSSSLMYLSKERALEFLDKFGAHRFLFGTDFPMWTPEEELKRFLHLGLDEETRDRILFGNFKSYSICKERGSDAMGEHDGHRERLGKRFLKEGMDVLQDDQILEILLFYALPRRDTNELARKLLKHFGSIAAVLEAPLPELKEVAGIGDHAAVLLRLITPLARRYLLSRSEVGKVLLTTQDCGNYLTPYFFGATEEVVYILCLDAKCKVLACRRLQEGNVNSASFSIRKAAEAALSCNASSVILAHNHTSGVAVPSKADVATTLQMKTALEPLGILLVDHIVVADNDFVSMADNGLLE